MAETVVASSELPNIAFQKIEEVVSLLTVYQENVKQIGLTNPLQISDAGMVCMQCFSFLTSYELYCHHVEAHHEREVNALVLPIIKCQDKVLKSDANTNVQSSLELKERTSLSPIEVIPNSAAGNICSTLDCTESIIPISSQSLKIIKLETTSDVVDSAISMTPPMKNFSNTTCDELDKNLSSKIPTISYHRNCKRPNNIVSDVKEETELATYHTLTFRGVNASYWKCKKCSLMLMTSEQIQWHCNLIHFSLESVSMTGQEQDDTSFTCFYCFSSNFGSLTVLHQHIYEDHNGGQTPFICCFEKCRMEFSAYTIFFRHYQEHKTLKQCSYCPKMLNGPASLRKHELFFHQVKPSMCPHCFQWTKPEKLNEHIQKCSQPFQFECNLCGEPFRSQIGLKGHARSCLSIQSNHAYKMKLIDGSQAHLRNFKCNVCKLVRKNKDFLKLHIANVHLNHKPKCGSCGKTFTNHFTLKKHQNTYTAEERKKFGQCPGRGRRSELVRTKNENGKYPCSLCLKEFPSAWALHRHEFIHKNDEQKLRFKCNFCQRKFTNKHSTTYHMRKCDRRPADVVIGHNPIYQCPTCGKNYTTKRSLNQHSHRCHSQEQLEIEFIDSVSVMNAVEEIVMADPGE